MCSRPARAIWLESNIHRYSPLLTTLLSSHLSLNLARFSDKASGQQGTKHSRGPQDYSLTTRRFKRRALVVAHPEEGWGPAIFVVTAVGGGHGAVGSASESSGRDQGSKFRTPQHTGSPPPQGFVLPTVHRAKVGSLSTSSQMGVASCFKPLFLL